MTLPELSLFPARGDDRLPALTAAQLAAGGELELGERVGAEVRQRMTLEPGPQILDRIELRRIGGQQRHLHGTLGAVEIVPNDPALVLRGAVPDDEHPALQLRAQRLEKLHDLRTLDRAVVEPEREARLRQPCDCRDVLPVEMKLHHRRTSLERPGAHPGWSFRQARFVDEDDQPSFECTLFLSAGQVLRFHARTAASSRSMARRSGFWELKPSAPSSRQTCTSLKRTPYSRSIRARTRLSVHNALPKPCAIAPCSSAARSPSSCRSSSCAGRPVAMERSASMPPSSCRAFQVYAVCRATPTAWAACAGVLPASISRPARTRLRVASSIFAMFRFSNRPLDWITYEPKIGCHDFGNSQ